MRINLRLTNGLNTYKTWILCFLLLAAIYLGVGALWAGETARKGAYIEIGFCKWKDSSGLLM